MALPRSFSQPHRLLATVVNALSSSPLHRRGYAVVANVSVKKVVVEEAHNGSEASSAWAPDPVTGYYRPINRVNEIDPVELRNLLLKNRTRVRSSESST